MSRESEHRRLAEKNAPGIRKKEEQRIQRRAWDLDPLKQFVRRYGWLDVIKSYIKRCRDEGYSKPWRYLTLPGPNASDIGFLLKEGILERIDDGTNRLNVAICDVDNAEQVANYLGDWGGLLAVSPNWLHKELNRKDSNLDQYFPFDVINMDLCDCLYPPSNDDNLRALEWIFLKQCGRSFLLFVTTNPRDLARDQLVKILEQNMKHSAGFKQAFVQRYKTNAVVPATRDNISFAQITLPKIIARLARENGYEMQEHFVARYKGNRRDEIIAHSFEFEPIGLKGRSKFEPRFDFTPHSSIRSRFQRDLSQAVQTVAQQKYETFIQVLPTRQSLDITAKLKGDKALNDKLESEAKALDRWYLKTS